MDNLTTIILLLSTIGFVGIIIYLFREYYSYFVETKRYKKQVEKTKDTYKKIMELQTQLNKIAQEFEEKKITKEEYEFEYTAIIYDLNVIQNAENYVKHN